ncbi:MAG: peptidyl-prolyl cis-trans isomerase, partial [Nitrospirota bacterium]|nr:peptidyl-prolyl cis-trans isomerase [Nitrospirota bacterium]
AEAVSKMKAGAISPVLSVDNGFVIFRLEGERFPEDPEAREKASQTALQTKRVKELVEYNKQLSDKYIKLNKKLVDSLDFESKKPGFENLLKDKRVIAEVKGDKPVTVGDLAQALKEKFFHDIDNAIRSKKLNKKKIGVLEEILGKRIFRLEALNKGIDKSERYLNMVKEYETSLVFGAFLKKVVVPEIKLSKEDVLSYYESHADEFTYPEMVKLDAIVFKDMKGAEATLEKLQRGDDLKWIKENAEGQVGKDEKGLMHFGGENLIVTEMPDDLQQTLSGVRAGDYRMYASPEKHYYILAVLDKTPPVKRPFEEVEQDIAKAVFGIKVNEAVEDWARRLRESSDVKVFMTNLNKP